MLGIHVTIVINTDINSTVVHNKSMLLLLTKRLAELLTEYLAAQDLLSPF